MLQICLKSLKFHVKTVVNTSNRHVVTKLIERKAMGLAATQARFLAITARKMNCEFQSMQVAQQKLSVTRDLQKISQDYQNSLSATKLIWDGEPITGDSADVYDLSYDVMMKASVLNGFEPFLVTDTGGRILLSETMFQAAVNAGVIDSNGSPINSENALTLNGRNNFLENLKNNNLIDAATLSNVKNCTDKDGYNKGFYYMTGIGAENFDRTQTNAMTSSKLFEYMKGVDTYNIKLEDFVKSLGLNFTSNSEDLKDGNDKDSDNKLMLVSNDNYLQSMDGVNLGDILSGKYEILVKSSNIKAKDFYEKIVDLIGNALGADELSFKIGGLSVDQSSYYALKGASEVLKSLDNTNKEYTSNDKPEGVKLSFNNIANAYSNARELNGRVKNEISGYGTVYSISLTNLAKSYLTQFAIEVGGFTDDFKIAETPKDSKYSTSDVTYSFMVKNENALNENQMMADYYNLLYNQISVHGAISDAKVRQMYTTDMDSLQNAIKNGNMFISSLHDDGYYYQDSYSLAGQVSEVRDEEAIARAEVEYNVQKSKLNTKEESLDLQMKNLDMEISALTTEYDTVKNMISKGIEKVFSMFST